MKIFEGHQVRWLGPASEAEVTEAESALGVRFPAMYRRFLLEHGCGLADHLEFYGLGGPRGGVPDLRWLLARLDRRKVGRPPWLIPFHFEGDGAWAGVVADGAPSRRPGEVLTWTPRPDEVLEVEASAPDFESWIRMHL